MASAIGTGKNSASCTENSISVFQNACQNPGSVNSCWKFARPTHGLCSSPSYRS